MPSSSSRFQFVTLRPHQLAYAAATTAPPPHTTSHHVETLAASSVASIADQFEPGASRRILDRRPSSIPSASADPTTPPTDRAAPAPRSNKNKTQVASRVMAFMSNPHRLAQDAEARERRDRLEARSALNAETRWESSTRVAKKPTAHGDEVKTAARPKKRSTASANQRITPSATVGATVSAEASPTASSTSTPGPSPVSSPSNSSDARSNDAPAPVDAPSAQSPTTAAVPASVKASLDDAKWRAEGLERRQQASAHNQGQDKRQWLRPNAHHPGEDYLPLAKASALARKQSSDAAASAPAPVKARSRAERWAEQAAQKYAQADKIRNARRIRPLRQ